MLDTIRRSGVTVAALAALGLGGAAIAGAADKSGSSSGTASSPSRPALRDRPALDSAVADKVKAAALAEVPGATVLRTEAGGPYGTPYHAHIRTSDGTLKVVLVNSSFTATAVQTYPDRAFRGGRDGRGRHGGPGGRGGPGETALTGTTKRRVEAAVLARYSGATIVRTESNDDSSAPYESHITTSAGRQLEVLVSKAFDVVDANEQPAHP
jgi:hypothetical protein